LGLVEKARKIGNTKYKMPKVEFQFEDEIKGEFRKIGATQSIMMDAYDSIYRTAKIEPDLKFTEFKKPGRKVKQHDSNTERQRKREEQDD
jgi:hypothetical protein